MTCDGSSSAADRNDRDGGWRTVSFGVDHLLGAAVILLGWLRGVLMPNPDT